MTSSLSDRLSALAAGPLTEDAVRMHVAPLFSRVLAAHRDRVYLANHSLGRPLDATSDDVTGYPERR